MKKPDYAAMYTLRADGRYMGYWRELDKHGKATGQRHAIYDRDPEKLYRKIQEKENPEPVVLSFDAAADAWAEKHWARIGAKTAETYKAPLSRVKGEFSGDAASEVTAQRILGHANVSTTLEIYTDLRKKHEIKNVGKFARSMSKLRAKAEKKNGG